MTATALTEGRPDLTHPFQCERGREEECSHHWFFPGGGWVKCGLPESDTSHKNGAGMSQTDIKPTPAFTFFASPDSGITIMYGDQAITLSNAGDAIELIRGLATVLAQHGYNMDDFLKGRG